MKYLFYEWGKRKDAIECKTFHEVLTILHRKKKPNRVYCVRFMDEEKTKEVIQIRYKQIESFTITEIL